VGRKKNTASCPSSFFLDVFTNVHLSKPLGAAVLTKRREGMVSEVDTLYSLAGHKLCALIDKMKAWK